MHIKALNKSLIIITTYFFINSSPNLTWSAVATILACQDDLELLLASDPSTDLELSSQ